MTQAQLIEAGRAPNVSLSVVSYEGLVNEPRRVLEKLARDLHLPSDAVFAMLSAPDLKAHSQPAACQGVHRKCDDPEHGGNGDRAATENRTGGAVPESSAAVLTRAAFARAGPWPLFDLYSEAAKGAG